MAALTQSAPEASGKREFRVRTERIERLISRIDSCQDPELRASARELVQSVVELHGAALERLVEIIAESEAGEAALDRSLEDPLVASLLLLHGLHPDGMETRVRRALDQVRPYLRSHHGDVDLVSVQDGVVRLRLVGSCGTCPSSAATLKNAVEEALYEAAPDVTELIAEDATAAPNASRLVILK